VRSVHRRSPLVWKLRRSALFFTCSWTLRIQPIALWLDWRNIHGIWLRFTERLEAEWWQWEHYGLFKRVLSRSLVKPWITDWIQYVHSLGLFSSSPRWYRVTVLPVFCLFFNVPLTRNYQYAKRMLFFSTLYSFQIQLDHFVLIVVLSAQQPRTVKDRKCCQCSAWVCKGHFNNTIQMASNNCKERSK